MENTIENKAQFLGNYIGCDIVNTETGKTIKSDYTSIWQCLSTDNDIRLQLKSLSDISDEDAIEVAKIICDCKVSELKFEPVDNPPKVHDSIKSILVSIYVKHPLIKKWKDYSLIQIDTEEGDVIQQSKDLEGEWQDDFTDNYIHVTDYLRSKSYALPFMNLSVEQQINFGWIKLNNSN